MQVDYLIIGGGVAGTIAAETVRLKDSAAKIAILEEEPYTLYSRVLMPAYLKGKIPREKLFLRRLANYQDQGIDFYPSTLVGAIDSLRKEVSTRDGKNFSYKKLLISAGGRPKGFTETLSSISPISPLQIQTLDDADSIKKIITNAASVSEKKVLVIGENFIALEFLAVFQAAEFEVHAASRKNLWGNENIFAKEGSRILEDNFRKQKIIVHHMANVSFIKNDDFYFQNGEHQRFPIWALGIGIKRNLSFLPDIRINEGILTDEYLRTSDPDIYAAGDIAEFYDIIYAKHRLVGNWTNAFLQGRTAASNMFGEATVFKSVSTYNIVNLGLNITFVGMVDGEVVDDIFEIAGEASLIRVFIRGGRTIGGVLINRFHDKLALSRIIEEGKGKDELEKTFK